LTLVRACWVSRAIAGHIERNRRDGRQNCKGKGSAVVSRRQLICPDGQSPHACHAQIARRANLSQPDGFAVTPKSAADFALSRPHQEGRFAVVTNVEAGCDGRELSTSSTNADGEVVWS
jgi:hypothetical protein